MKQSTKFLPILFSAAIISMTATSLYGDSAPQIRTENALRVELNPDGFAAISSAVSRQVLTEIVDAPLEDLNENIGYGVQAKLTSLSYSIKFKDFHLTLGSNELIATVEFDEIKVRVPKAQFSKNVGTVITTTCRNTTMTAGSNSSVTLAMHLEPTILDGKVALAATQVTFPLPPEEFSVDGPESCSGALGVGHLIRYVMNRAIIISRDKIAAAVEKKVRDVIPTMSDTLNNMIIREIPVALGQGENAPLKNLILNTRPYQVTITPERALFALSIDIREGTITKSLASSRSDIVPFGNVVDLGAFGIRTAFINDILATAMPALPTTIPVSTDSSVLREIFSRRGLSSIIPDINTVEMDSDLVSARIGFDHAPEISTSVAADGSALISLKITQMHLFIDITQNGNKVPYFELLFDATMGIELAITNGQLTFNLVQPAHVDVDGHWADGYTPRVPLFERDVARTIFFTALDILCNGGILARFEVPEFQLSPNQTLTLASPYVDADFVALKLISP